jgi:hypothetical protein
MCRSTRYAQPSTVAFSIFTYFRHLCRAPKEIEPEILVEDSGKGEGNPKVIKPLRPMINEEIPKVVNEERPRVMSPPSSP